MLLSQVEPAPRDAILGVTAAFREDDRPEKVNLSVGVYQDETGTTPLLDCVREAESRLIAATQSKGYLPIPGADGYRRAVCGLLFSGGQVGSERIAFAHTPGGTGALRIAGEFLKANLPKATLWTSTPTWPNHPNIFAAAGVPMQSYRYFDKSSNAIDLDGMLADLEQVPSGDAVLLHICCHNPTGIDPSVAQWKQIAAALRGRGVLPVLDFAYQGFADGIEEDARGMHEFCEEGAEFLVCSSYSKNFSLYRERVGALTVVSADAKTAEAVQSQVNRVIRSSYSNPPAHGASIVECILGDEALTAQWLDEVAGMRGRINGMRHALADALVEAGVAGDYSFIKAQRGMFSFTGLTKEQVDRLREDHAIYVVGSGRINVAGLTDANVGYVAEAIRAVTAG